MLTPWAFCDFAVFSASQSAVPSGNSNTSSVYSLFCTNNPSRGTVADREIHHPVVVHPPLLGLVGGACCSHPARTPAHPTPDHPRRSAPAPCTPRDHHRISRRHWDRREPQRRRPCRRANRPTRLNGHRIDESTDPRQHSSAGSPADDQAPPRQPRFGHVVDVLVARHVGDHVVIDDRHTLHPFANPLRPPWPAGVTLAEKAVRSLTAT